MPQYSPAELRRLKRESKQRAFDLAAELGVAEGALVAAEVGYRATRIDATLGRLIPAVETLGEVMALTRNRSCVIEKIGTYAEFHDGDHAAMTLDDEIDLRMFPRYFRHAFTVETETDHGISRSIQVFDATGSVIHKVHLRANSNLEAYEALKRDLALDDQSDEIAFEPTAEVEGAKFSLDRVDTLREEWSRMTDTHQFNTLVRRLKMNRLGAYRIVGAPHVRPLDVSAVQAMFDRMFSDGLRTMLFVGNQGCIEIHSGPIHSLKPMGPWINVMDPRFNLHLRGDHVAEVWAVDKPTKRGPVISVEAFDADGALIFQAFTQRAEKGGTPDAWAQMVAELPALAEAAE